MQRISILLLGLLLTAAESRAWDVEPADRNLYYWFMGGFGATAQQWSKLGVAAGLDVSLQKGSHLLLLRWMQNNEREPQKVTINGREFDLQITPVAWWGFNSDICDEESIIAMPELSNCAGSRIILPQDSIPQNCK